MALEILIVDDEADIRALVAGVLGDEGYRTLEAANSDEALAQIATHRPSLVLLDIWLHDSELDGMQILEKIQSDYTGTPVVMMSGHGTVETAVTAINLGAYDFIEKPFNSDRLLLVVKLAHEDSRLRRENEDLRARTGTGNDLVGKSSAINQVRQAIDKVAPSNSRVLISGPAGSGKEVAARMMHNLSDRSSGPFVVLNCASLEPDRVEIELFGTENDDASGDAMKTGTFEMAHKGTLFLDEIADMPMETQGKIVRVLQEQIFERVGGTTRIEVDVRVVASSSRDLNDEISAGNFREDLFYRLSVVPIDIPPLKDRIDDIPDLVDMFIKHAAIASGRATRGLTPAAIAALQSYGWPGNVRELKNIIERVLIMAPGDAGDPIGPEMLPGDIDGSAGGDVEGSVNSSEIMGLPLKKARQVFEREYLHSQVTRFGGNISRTAAFVGMERSALHRKLKSLGIQSSGRIKEDAMDD
ncbi:MAG: sigma-54-dependent Fis family transcriptional regulator [Rhodospirillaceae bacterium]|jgi:two-component system, NtrC family, nitrogen regulation response regulator NtrX|nr:sigma-54-dependent Fis family transcriptional regulator [Rhodospirillaceae bacterium]MBT4220366.1 sigma-54-dependent Fis family transcriptional regulator [Rhodospirillaceae bacterium]MBT4464593.1 sigma-54-dependent Fis family transcriptional regulator [Rhodospirillaceae bacterium]MBT5014121.1 sigma-54-dependent Fis family transcriptional regulator [Rhodospirillaceae bacterium]MBT7355623.1 sigma-54-dependent Fis family transcriptional regulator [Rhodospirillaceae bacterium]